LRVAAKLALARCALVTKLLPCLAALLAAYGKMNSHSVLPACVPTILYGVFNRLGWNAMDFNFLLGSGTNVMSDSIPMTRDGYNKLRRELDRMEQEEMPMIVSRIADARAEGDLKENAEYHGARESQGLLQARINELKGKLSRAVIMDATSGPRTKSVSASGLRSSGSVTA